METRMRHVLVIDDNLLIRRLIASLLQEAGTMVTVAGDGREASDIVQSGQKFDVIFLDLILPSISGRDVLKIIRADLVNADTYVVLMSGALSLIENDGELLNERLTLLSKGSFTVDGFRQMLKKIFAAASDQRPRFTVPSPDMAAVGS